MVKHADGNINYFIGYRSSLSLKNKDTWKFANEDCGKRWLKIGKIMLVPTILVHIPVYGKGVFIREKDLYHSHPGYENRKDSGTGQ